MFENVTSAKLNDVSIVCNYLIFVFKRYRLCIGKGTESKFYSENLHKLDV